MWKHLAGCAVGIVVVGLVLLVARDSIPGGGAVALIALACPVMMIVMMRGMNHDHKDHDHKDDDASNRS